MSNMDQMISTMEKNKQGQAGRNVWRGVRELYRGADTLKETCEERSERDEEIQEESRWGEGLDASEKGPKR